MTQLESFQPTRPNVWEQIWDVTYESESIIPGRFTPIPNIELPLLLQSRLLVIATSSQSARPHWQWAGTLYQQHVLPDISSQPIDGQQTICRLNSIQLITMSDITADYRLTYVVPRWLQDISLGIWEYNGPVDSNILDQFSTVVDEINSTQAQIQDLRDFNRQRFGQMTTRLNRNRDLIRDVRSDTRDILQNL